MDNLERSLEVSPPRPWVENRLPPNIRPSAYHLWLYPNLHSGLFSGRVTIVITVSDVHQSFIAVHVKGLQITTSRLTLNNEERTEVELKDCFEYPENEYFICEPKNSIAPNEYRLYFEFNGKLTNKIVGFYRSTYKDPHGDEKRIATSKFEPTFARQAFPCFDEPNYKAIFHIELVKPLGNEYIALSNMPQKEEIANQPSRGLVTVQFDPTLPMSTYLACFIVCDFDYLEGVPTRFGFPITVYARREFISDLTFARDFAISAAEYFCDYFQIMYPLPKLDLIAIPDFVSGAMENWGLITFRETRLVCSNNHSDINSQLDVALTVAHEISHMWFGDLVTMKWWDDLWLNEGFATFMEYKAVQNKYQSWEVNYVFLEQEVFSVMRIDATLSSHPIIARVNNADQINEIFDVISYKKGASIIRMLENTVGLQEFQAGIKEYLEHFRLGNADTDNLWFHLQNNANHMNIESLMKSWTLQMGFPVLRVKVNKEKNLMSITQERFLSDPNAVYDKRSSPYNYKWEVPITYVTSEVPNHVQPAWFRRTEDVVVIKLPDSVQWVKVNVENKGFYLVNYEDWMWKQLHGVLTTSYRILHPSDRASLIFNAFRLAEANQLSYEIALLMIDYLNHETHFCPWNIAFRELSLFNKKFYGTDTHAPFKKYVRSLIKGSRTLTWNIDDRANYATKTLQMTILELGCAVGNKVCLGQAVTLFKQWLTEPSMKLHPELALMIMFYGIEQTSEQEWKSLWELYLKESDPQYKVKIMKALCASKETQVIWRFLEYGKNESLIRSQDYLSMIGLCSMNPTANPIVWDFVRKEWPYLIDRYTLNDRYLGNVIPQITKLFSSETRLTQMEDFFAQYPDAGAGATARRLALEGVKNNMLWRQTHFETLSKWFKNATENIHEEQA